jgi:putative toxin-antitoxin system antitoxin component (TIGR02293 family)
MGSTATAAAELLGGVRVLGARVRGEMDLARLVEEGLPPRSLEALAEHAALDMDEVWRLVLPRRTWLYRRARRQRLTPIESDRASRLARVAALTARTFGKADLAYAWLHRPCRALGGKVPLTLLGTDAGSRLVEDELTRIEDGVYA